MLASSAVYPPAPGQSAFSQMNTTALVPKKKLSPFFIYVKHRKPILEATRPELNMKEIL